MNKFVFLKDCFGSSVDWRKTGHRKTTLGTGNNPGKK